MGLLRDLLIKDPKTKRKVTMVIYIIVILVLLISPYTPFIRNIAYDEGYEFGTTTCIGTFEEFDNLSRTNESVIEEFLNEFFENISRTG